jgi:myo-inositol 2-dehydrogenase / D-chiro-inositol 1-dehydrogenase
MEQNHPSRLSRREFVKSAAVAAAATTAFPYVLRGAESDKPLRIGLIGCGGRGTGAAQDAMNADPKVKVVALADLYKDRLNGCRNAIKGQSEVEEKNCFLGLDAYKKLLELDLDYVILATPPYFRPEHLTAVLEAGKNVFTEKPVGVDPVGLRKVLEAGKIADQKKLCVVAGTQRRHENKYLEMMKRIHGGEIGTIRAAQCYWNGGQLWYRKREAGWSDMEWMVRDWVNWSWLSGDHVVEQHVHNLDIINWATKSHPRRVVAMGGRARRVTGDQFDFFSADLSYPDPEAPDKADQDIHVHSMCRQINDCVNNVSERVIGQKAIAHFHNASITGIGKIEYKENHPYVQEHADLIKAIRTGEQINEAANVATSTMTAVMIRMSAYTGKEVSWEDVMESGLTLARPDYELTEANVKAHIPVPGK